MMATAIIQALLATSAVLAAAGILLVWTVWVLDRFDSALVSMTLAMSPIVAMLFAAFFVQIAYG